MSDGAHLGVSAGRALDTILGGTPSPGTDEVQSLEEVRERVLAAPLPGDGPPPWERDGDTYSLATDSLAHAFLLLADERPELMDEVRFYPDDYEIEILRGKQLDPTTAIWEAYAERWPGADEWLGGATGFMVGFAFNVARFLHGKFPAPNPAIVEIRPN